VSVRVERSGRDLSTLPIGAFAGAPSLLRTMLATVPVGRKKLIGLHPGVLLRFDRTEARRARVQDGLAHSPKAPINIAVAPAFRADFVRELRVLPPRRNMPCSRATVSSRSGETAADFGTSEGTCTNASERILLPLPLGLRVSRLVWIGRTAT
jgi:hypothetical protein